MQELRAVLNAAGRLAARGEEGVLATVVAVEGSTYRRPGARLLVGRDGDWVGGVSGGCLEGDLVRKAWWRTAHGPAVVAYDSTTDDDTIWQLGLGCNGVVRVLLERIGPTQPDPLAFVRRCFEERIRGVLATVVRAEPASSLVTGQRFAFAEDADREGPEAVRATAADCLNRDRSRTTTIAVAGGEAEVFFEVVRPPVRLAIFGAGFDAVPLVAAGRALGWHVVVAARRPRSIQADEVIAGDPATACDRLRLDGRTAAVVMNHHYPDDTAALAALLRSPVRYIGVLGPRERTERILAQIGETELDHLDRLHAPVGLDVGADAPEEIAAAVVSQVIAVFAERAAGHLRDRPGPIHRREPAGVIEAVS
jgi:xanthine/CO dehydrogenase XdhC/CoxF family maturation factor